MSGIPDKINTNQFSGKILEDGYNNNYVLGMGSYVDISGTGTYSRSIVGDYMLFMFTSGTATVKFTQNIVGNVLIVAGGGGGGAGRGDLEGGGGGGGGGVGIGNLTFTRNVPYTVTVGNGGVGGRANDNDTSINTPPTNGINSSIVGDQMNEIAIGGGYGAITINNGAYWNGTSGGSGGGATGGWKSLHTQQPFGLANRGTGSLAYYGNNGGTGGLGGGGGGGAGQNGGNGAEGTNNQSAGGAGGNGIMWPLTMSYYGGGGGGAYAGSYYQSDTGSQYNLNPGGLGGGGNGSGGANHRYDGSAGLLNTGGGGGAGYSSSSYKGGNGGSGIVIIAIKLNLSLLKYTFSGIPDVAFGNAGYLPISTDLSYSDLFFSETNYDMISYPNGYIAVGFYNSSAKKTYLNRITYTGTIDASYTIDTGNAYTNMCMSLSPLNGNVYMIQSNISNSTVITQINYAGNYTRKLLTPSYKPLSSAFDLGGNLYITGNDNRIYSYTPQCDLNLGFNGVGYLTTSKTGSRLSSILIQPDGKLLVSGTYTVTNKATSYLMRVSPTGTTDTQFGSSGYTSDFTVNSSNTYIYNIMYTTNEKIIAIGGSNADSSGNGNVIVRRYNADGQIDTGFNGGSTYTESSSFLRNGIICKDGNLLAINNTTLIKYYIITDITKGYVLDKNTNNYQILPPYTPSNVVCSTPASSTIAVSFTPSLYPGGTPIQSYRFIINGNVTDVSSNVTSINVNANTAFVTVYAISAYGQSSASYGGTAPNSGPSISSVVRNTTTGNLIINYSQPNGYYYPAPTNYYYQIDSSNSSQYVSVGTATGSFSLNVTDASHTIYMISTYTVGSSNIWTSPSSFALEPKYVISPQVLYAKSTAKITYTNKYIFHTFTSNGTINIPYDTIIPVLIIGGGGSGSSVPVGTGTIPDVGGGGGSAGQMIYGNVSFKSGTYTVVVGSGGSLQNNGTPSSIYGTDVNIVANGGNAGYGGVLNTQSVGSNGGNTIASTTASGFNDYLSFANNGGTGSTVTSGTLGGCGGGGGGAGGAGGNGNGILNGGVGGTGMLWPVNNTMYAYGGSGGGGTTQTLNSGGGNGAMLTNTIGGYANVPGSGGGGGKTYTNGTVGSGGSGSNGIVIMALPTSIFTFKNENVLHPPGTIIAYLGTIDPNGWVVCDGQTRTATDNRYGALIMLGVGSGTDTSYTPPDYRNMYLKTTGTGINWIMKL